MGEDVTVVLAKPGYAFAGWYEGDKKISENEFITMQDREMEITAKWVVCPITLEKSIAEAGTVSGVSGTTAIGEEVTITAATKNGYTWVGWYNGDHLYFPSRGQAQAVLLSLYQNHKKINFY